MVARIKSGKSLQGAINYNENKVKQGKAELIHANRYPKSVLELNFHDKLGRLKKLAELNQRTTTNCLHISLNFEPKENLSAQKLVEIAGSYMDKIGFGQQPYLVYRHDDAAHQHMHIVTTNIQKDGKRISLHNLGRTLSEKARLEIEVNYNLVKAGGRAQKEEHPLKPAKLGKAVYGKAETKRAISNIVNAVVNQYRFTSLASMNAILRKCNVMADRGTKGSRMFERNGLVYSIVDESGKRIGVPVKASEVAGKPTINFLNQKFAQDEEFAGAFRQPIKKILDACISKSADPNQFSELLKGYNIDAFFHTNASNFIFGVTYIDHNNKVAFKGSDLGKCYSAAAIRQAWSGGSNEDQPLHSHKQDFNVPGRSTNSLSETPSGRINMLQLVMDTDKSFAFIPYHLKGKRKRKKKRR